MRSKTTTYKILAWMEGEEVKLDSVAPYDTDEGSWNLLKRHDPDDINYDHDGLYMLVEVVVEEFEDGTFTIT